MPTLIKGVNVRVYANPSLERSVIRTETHVLGDAIKIRAGALEVLSDGQVIKAYGVGHWIDAEVEFDYRRRS